MVEQKTETETEPTHEQEITVTLTLDQYNEVKRRIAELRRIALSNAVDDYATPTERAKWAERYREVTDLYNKLNEARP